jgi:hypothetical protein
MKGYSMLKYLAAAILLPSVALAQAAPQAGPPPNMNAAANSLAQQLIESQQSLAGARVQSAQWEAAYKDVKQQLDAKNSAPAAKADPPVVVPKAATTAH